jgi:DNA-binding PadR family transcriptional regulator
MSSHGMAGDWPGRRNVRFARGGPRGRFPWPDDIEGFPPPRPVRGGPPFAFGPMMFGPPFGRARGRRRRGDVRTALLRLLADEPRNGYQLMQAIDERSGGRWRPSPGSVYPALSQLEDEGLIRATERDGAKLFEITDQGRERLGESKTDPAPWAEEQDPEAPDLHKMASLVIQIGKAAWQVAQEGNERQTEQAFQTLAETRRTLYRILAEDGETEQA